MSFVKEYFKEQFKWEMFILEHPKPSDFFLGRWQTTRSSVPLLIFRGLLFLCALCIMLSSMILYILAGVVGYWFIYLTHWGLMLVTVTTGFAAAVSARCYLYGPISAEFTLPWYVKIYWVLYNTGIPIAFLITIFYWVVLFPSGQDEELNHALDIAVHGLNSVIMFMLMALSCQPMRLLHFYQPLSFSLTYMVFGLIYYLAGGVDQNGNPWVYSVIYWGNPGPTIGYIAITAVLLLVVYIITLCLTALRDCIAKLIIRPSVTVHIEEGMPLRQPGTAKTY